MQIESWLAFCSIELIATATPGPAVLLVITNSLMVGFNKSLVTIFGNITGLLLMSVFSVLGLSAIVLHSGLAFTIIKTLGAVYLVYMGVKLWKNGIAPAKFENPEKENVTVISLYLQGLLVALTNPKAIVFTTALFPQFVVVSEPLLPQFSLLAVSFMMLSFLCLSAYSLLEQRIKGVEKIDPNGLLGKVFGSTFIGAGCFLATVQNNR